MKTKRLIKADFQGAISVGGNPVVVFIHNDVRWAMPPKDAEAYGVRLIQMADAARVLKEFSPSQAYVAAENEAVKKEQARRKKHR